MEKPVSNNLMNTKQQSTTTPTKCKICGDSAIYSYFGVIACHPCRVFFKRSAEQKKVNRQYVFSFIYIHSFFQKPFKCVFDGHCEVNVNNRHVCKSCRLDKCFARGMRTEMIRSSLSKTNKTRQERRITSTALVRLNEPQRVREFNFQ
jgi:hypothetical protein